ncbi:GntR family transcriptional regulator [Sciscionella marina]|uniref:GntR family transcriptional regulator n=1 Tax=Sciscionella marina TaxID=508770 RepID=UPI0003801CBF|nr:GntR family transcriptional regulator [Sciscionella marina]
MLPAPAPPESRRNWILRHLRHRIATGEFTAGDRLVERDLSAAYNLSRGPVREAIMVLEHEGLVVTHPYRGAVVAEISQAEITEILVPIRLVIERAAFRAVAETPPDGLVEHLSGIVARMERRSSSALDAEQLADLDVEFHEAVITAAGHTQSLQIWRTLQPRVRAYFLRDAPQHGEPGEIARQHRHLLDELRTEEPERVDAALTNHVHTYLDQSRATERTG